MHAPLLYLTVSRIQWLANLNGWRYLKINFWAFKIPISCKWKAPSVNRVPGLDRSLTHMHTRILFRTSLNWMITVRSPIFKLLTESTKLHRSSRCKTKDNDKKTNAKANKFPKLRTIPTHLRKWNYLVTAVLKVIWEIWGALLHFGPACWSQHRDDGNNFGNLKHSWAKWGGILAQISKFTPITEVLRPICQPKLHESTPNLQKLFPTPRC